MTRMIQIVGVLTCLLAMFQLSHHNHWFLCSVNDRNGVRTTNDQLAAVRGNRTWAAGLQ